MKSNKEVKEALLKLHFGVILAGTSGLFGRWITMSETLLSWYRVMFSLIIMLILLPLYRKILRKIRKHSVAAAGGQKATKTDDKSGPLARLAPYGIGVMLCFHWMFFFGSVKAANVSIAAVCLSLVPFITAILEPILIRSPFVVMNFLYSILSVLGVACIFGVDTQFRLGIFYGTLSSTLIALMMIANKSMRSHKMASATLLYKELIGGTLAMTCVVALMKIGDPTMVITPSMSDLVCLVLLAAVVTIAPNLLKIQALAKVDAFTVNLVNNMEPVYSIILAIIIFNEAQQLSYAFVIGIVLILASVLLQTRSMLRQ